MKNSVIIPFHSNSNLLSMCISSLEKALDLSENEIIVVDNNSLGSQIPVDLNIQKRCRVISIKENMMYPRAINIGAENAKGNFLIFCDADTCVTKGFDVGLINSLNDDSIGYSSAKLLNMYTNSIQEFGITSSYYNFPHPYAGRSLDFELVSKDHYPLAGCAACSAIKRELFLRIGGFDKNLVHSYSDIDLCIRLKEMGYKTVCVSNSIAYHCGSSTTGSGMGPSLKEDTKGIFSAKHPDIPISITKYIDSSCELLIRKNKHIDRVYFILDCSTIANSELYINRIVDNLCIDETERTRIPAHRRDAVYIDYLNFVPFFIREYKVPILYFVDNFNSFKNNSLWKSCREERYDIVADRNANIELLANII
jgi:GT2 family glycosyltransferase